ncbi:hypothetical protein AOLI_G00154260 [Acnodon oligacanthus]
MHTRTTDHPPPAGYPLVCLTACDRRHSQFSALEAVCVSEGLNSSVSEFRWFVGGAEAGVGRSLKELEEGVFMAPVRDRLLDGVYFGSGWRVQCAVRAVGLSGQRGLEQHSTDKSSPHTQDLVFGGVPFAAQLAKDTPGAEPLVRQEASDGFSLSSAPLFQAAAGRQWYVHVVYTVRSSKRSDRHTRSLRSKDQYHHSVAPSTFNDSRLRTSEAKDELIGQQSGRGTNLQPIGLQRAPSALQVPGRGEAGLDWPVGGASLRDSEETASWSRAAALAVAGLVICDDSAGRAAGLELRFRFSVSDAAPPLRSGDRVLLWSCSVSGSLRHTEPPDNRSPADKQTPSRRRATMLGEPRATAQ